VPPESGGISTFFSSLLEQITKSISFAREQLERQRALIRELAKSREDTNAAEALFRTMRRTLERLEEDRGKIEDALYTVKAVQD
jgi:uncharacterized protein YigA (DUF484 family)